MFSIGDRFRVVREDAGFTQEELAVKLGIKQYNISKIETGEIKNPDILIIKELCRIAGISVDTFLNHQIKPIVLTEDLIELIEKARRLDSNQISKLKEFLDAIL